MNYNIFFKIFFNKFFLTSRIKKTWFLNYKNDKNFRFFEQKT